jgi:hypothetical protein
MIVKKPKVVKDFIANSIFDNKIENSDLYDISDKEIKDIIEYSREFFNAKIIKNFDEDYDSDNKEFEEYDSENDPEYIASSNDEIIPEEEAETTLEEEVETTLEEEAIIQEVIPQDESNEKEEPIIEKLLDFSKDKYYEVNKYFIIYTIIFILYNIAKFFLEKRTTKSLE